MLEASNLPPVQPCSMMADTGEIHRPVLHRCRNQYEPTRKMQSSSEFPEAILQCTHELTAHVYAGNDSTMVTSIMQPQLMREMRL